MLGLCFSSLLPSSMTVSLNIGSLGGSGYGEGVDCAA